MKNFKFPKNSITEKDGLIKKVPSIQKKYIKKEQAAAINNKWVTFREKFKEIKEINCITKTKDNLFLNILFESIAVSVMFFTIISFMLGKNFQEI